MRINLYCGFLLMLSILLFTAHSGHAQSSTAGGIHDIQVSVELNNEALESCFKSIERQTGLLFAFLPDQVDPYTRISLPKATRTISATLDIVLEKTSLTYKQMNNSIVIFERSGEPKAAEATVTSVAKEVPDLKVVTGIVTGPDLEPIPGVNVQLKGASTVPTDLNGRYTTYARINDVLVFSFVGYKTVEAKVSEHAVIDLTLEYDIPLLDAVQINAGYWKLTEREQTGNISRVTAEDIEKQPVSNPLVALEGRMPGVYIQQHSGVPGGGVSIQIRGTNSLRPEGNYPLYIIDGVPFPSASVSSNAASGEIIRDGNPLNNINPADIESVEILKDADATAIYGSRGANGVVLITTKTGHNGLPRVTADFRQGIGKVTRTMDLLNTQQWLEMRKEAFRNDFAVSPIPRPNNVSAPDLTLWDTTRYTDWQKVLIGGTAQITDAKASFTGGDAQTQYLFSAGYYKESTVFPGDFAFRKGSAHFSFNHVTDDDKIKFSLQANYTATGNSLPSIDPTVKALELSPVAPEVYDSSGALNWAGDSWTNPFALLRQTYSANTGTAVVNSVISFNVWKGLTISSRLGYTKMQVEELKKEPIKSFTPSFTTATGTSYFADNKVGSWTIEPQAEYASTIHTDGKLKLFVGSTFQQTLSTGQTLKVSGYTNDDLMENIPSGGPGGPLVVMNDDYNKYRYNALFGRANFNWKEKYYINATGRRDGSTRFGPGRKFANFAAVGAAWIFSAESFAAQVLPFLSHGKLRASYGITGSDMIGDYQYLASYIGTSGLYNGSSGTIPTRLYNPDYSWESNKKAEIALELGFASDRILLSTSYYDHRSSSQLVGQSLSVVTGYPSIQYNIAAEVQNTGVEVILNTENVSGNDFTWKTYFNITVPRNKLIKYPGLKGSQDQYKYVIGQPLSIQQKYHLTGVDPETGIYTFADADDSGNISTPGDYLALKKITQDLYGGIQNSLQYKGWKLDVFFQFVKQTGMNYLQLFRNMPGSRLSNQPVQVMARWQNPGDITSIQRFTQRAVSANPAVVAYNNAWENSDYAISDASFVRLKNISLSWQLKSKWLTGMKLNKGIVYLQGQNLLTFTKYAGYDPELPGTSRVLPPLRILTAGVQLTF